MALRPPSLLHAVAHVPPQCLRCGLRRVCARRPGASHALLPGHPRCSWPGHPRRSGLHTPPPLLAPGLVNDEKWGITHVIGSYIIKLQKVVVETTVTGFKPARQNARRFQVFLLNHSDILSTSLLKQTCFSINHVHYNNYSATYFLFLFGVAACSLLATPTKREMVYAIPLSQP